jgi:glycosyltransferase involved in cell wall biosynthesis
VRVLHVNQRAGFVGGVERILHDTASSLSIEGWPQALLHEDASPDSLFLEPFEAASADPQIVERFRPDVVLIHKTGQPERARSIAGSRPAARMVHDHDLVCLRRHKYLPVTGSLCERAAGRACYTNLCFVQRGAPGSALPITFRGLGAQRREMAANAGMRRYIVGSQWMKQQLDSNGFPADRIDVVHPIPRSIQALHLRAPSGSNEILFVGQVIRGKGVDLLVRALSCLSRPWKATVVGEGNHLGTCRDLAGRLGVADRIEFTGWVDHDQLDSYYSRARFAVVPSRWPEPFGMVGPEAMARGRPVVAFSAGGIPDWLEDGRTGLLVPPGDIRGLASAMDRLLADSGLTTRLGEAAASFVKDHLNHGNYLGALRRSLEASQ